MTENPTTPDLPRVRLKPKANARGMRRGFPWVYDNDLVTDRRTRAITPGALAVLEDSERKPISLVAVNPTSKIICRVLDIDLNAPVDTGWFATRFERALALRERLYDAPYYRLVHAEADGMPGVVIDRFGDTCVVQPNAAWADARLDQLAEALAQVTGVTTILKNASGRTRALEGLDDQSSVLLGEAPTKPLPVPMNGATYMADLTGGQKPVCFMTSAPTMLLQPAWPRTRGCWMSFRMSGALRLPRWQAAQLRRWPSMGRSRHWNWQKKEPRPVAWQTASPRGRAMRSKC